jgi:small subunit ribosomal protein S6e
MKLNIAYPATGCQKLLKIDDEKILSVFYDKRIGQEIGADRLGDEWKGYVLRISGGNDLQGFCMMQGVLTNTRVRLLFKDGMPNYKERRSGVRKRKSVRGCIVDSQLSVLDLVVVRKGDGEIPGLTDTTQPRRLGPKKVGKIRKLFNLSKEDDVRQYVVHRPLPEKEGKKPRSKAPKIQRLVTPARIQRKRKVLALKKQRSEKNKAQAAEYAKLLAQRQREKRQALLSRRRSSNRTSTSSA